MSVPEGDRRMKRRGDIYLCGMMHHFGYAVRLCGANNVNGLPIGVRFKSKTSHERHSMRNRIIIALEKSYRRPPAMS